MQTRLCGTTVILVLAIGCAKRDRSENEDEVDSIGPQFWKYDLSEYQIVDRDEVRGLGGRWISVRYAKSKDSRVTRHQVMTRIKEALKQDGWSSTPAVDQWLSKSWEISSADICFRRGSRSGEPKPWFFKQQFYINDDASFICIYAEVGW